MPDARTLLLPVKHKDSWITLTVWQYGVDTAAGKWYMSVHSYENGYRTLGRQFLLLPVEWTADGWYRVPQAITADSAIPLPVPGAVQHAFLDPSDDFTAPELGLQWGFWHEFDPSRFTTGKGALVLDARGKSIAETPVLTTPVGGHSYTVEIDVEIEQGCQSGLLLFYDPEHTTGILLDSDASVCVFPMASSRAVRKKVLLAPLCV